MRSGFLTVKMSPILFFPQLNPRPMDILIPDTSSLINIHKIYVGRTHIIDVLNQLFSVQVSREIPHMKSDATEVIPFLKVYIALTAPERTD